MMSPCRFGISEVERRVGAERSTISRWTRAGRFPRPVYFGCRRFWSEEQIAGWEAAQFDRQLEAERQAHQRAAVARAARWTAQGAQP